MHIIYKGQNLRSGIAGTSAVTDFQAFNIRRNAWTKIILAYRCIASCISWFRSSGVFVLKA